MLQNYSLEGFKSFKHYTEVDMKKTQYQTLEKDNVVDGILNTGDPVHRSSLLSGIS